MEENMYYNSGKEIYLSQINSIRNSVILTPCFGYWHLLGGVFVGSGAVFG